MTLGVRRRIVVLAVASVVLGGCGAPSEGEPKADAPHGKEAIILERYDLPGGGEIYIVDIDGRNCVVYGYLSRPGRGGIDCEE